jgi:hypothetical protein
LFSLKNAEIEPEKVIKLRVKINVTSVWLVEFRFISVKPIKDAERPPKPLSKAIIWGRFWSLIFWEIIILIIALKIIIDNEIIKNCLGNVIRFVVMIVSIPVNARMFPLYATFGVDSMWIAIMNKI